MVESRMKTLLGLLPLLFAFHAAAQALGPEELVKKVTADVLEALKSDKDLLADRKRALALAEQKVLPHVDFREAAQLAVGKLWWKATPAQQERIATEFRGLLIRIYSNALDTYRGQTMQVLPLRMAAGATETTVRNRYLKPGAPPVPVDYAMKKTPEGWKIYDISVEGVSLVLTYRSEFEQITRTSGIDGLIKRLAEKNA
ncbi:MAG: ABC transporter substrate-binding protein [Betaproteobacteria bacterium]|nr:ABC transporter substrate-binding protein [Betaproteobacteria bacterium]